MQITTYRETYNKPVRNIAVPNELQKGGFEVYFIPLSVRNSTKKQKSIKKGGAGSIMRAYFADIPPPTSSEDDFVLPSRKSNRKPVDFD